jgi:hypothetical protein
MKTRFVISYTGKLGIRTILGGRRANSTYDTRGEAETSLAAFLGEENLQRLLNVTGARGPEDFRVDGVDCHDHGDPISCWAEHPHLANQD